MRPRINLATRRYIDNRQLNLLLTVITAFLASSLLFLVFSIFQNFGELQRLTSEIAGFEGKFRSTGGGVKEADYQALLTRIKFANDLIEKKSLNWLGLLQRMEELVPDGVAISTIEPDLKKDGLKVTGAALRFANIRRLVENLEGSGFFTDVYLLSQRTTSAGESQKGLEFEISCRLDFRRL